VSAEVLIDNQKCAVLEHPADGPRFNARFLDLAGHYGFTPRALSREEASLFFRLLVRRYERGTLIVTSNNTFADWGEVFNDQVLATAILDRLLHHATTLNIKGERYRLREKKKAGLLGRRPRSTGEEVPDES
jgi:hypothetical protein